MTSCSGWHVNTSILANLFKGSLVPSDEKTLEKKLCDFDIRDFGEPCLSNNMSKTALTGPVVLQLNRYRNVSQPKLKEGVRDSGDVARVSLTDGHTSVSALILQSIKGINADTPPGVKLLISGVANLENGFLILNPSNVIVIGGRVEKLYNKWIVERHMVGENKQTIRSECEAPRWISFGKSESRAYNPSTLVFKANDVLKPTNQKDEDDGSNFEQQRKDNINAIRQLSRKVFVAPNVRAPQELAKPNFTSKAKPSSSDCRDLDCHKKRNSRRYGGVDSDVTAAHSHPSGKSTLFDFMASNVLLENSYENPTNSCASTINAQCDPVNEKQLHRKQGRTSLYKRDNSKGRNPNALDSQCGSNHREKKFNERNRGEKKKFGSHGSFENPQVANRTSRTSAFSNITSYGGKRHMVPTGERDVIHEEMTQSISFGRSRCSEVPKKSFSLGDHKGVKKQNLPMWKVGDYCMAPWNDGMYYLATIVNIGSSGMCDVRYCDYGNICTVPQGALLLESL